MKKQLLFLFSTFIIGNLYAPPKHNLKDNGLAVALNRVCSGNDLTTLAPIIQQYYARVQQGQYDIPIEDLQALHAELLKIAQKNSKRRLLL